MQDGLLRVEGVRFAYDEAACWMLSVDQLSLGSERMVCLVGPNGSGKSTLLRLLAGVIAPQSGRIALAGKDMQGMSRATIARRIGYLPQESPALFDLSIDEVVMMGRYVHGAGWGGVSSGDLAAVARALDAVDLVPLRRRRLSQVSGGERRRALIASVLAQEPEILLLDEPTSALDIHHAVDLMRLLAGFRPPEPAVIVVTHDINLASLFSDRMLLLQAGQVLTDGAAACVVTPANLHAVYGGGFLLERHPQTGVPLVVPMREMRCCADGKEALHVR